VIAHDDPGTADSLRHAVRAAAGWQVLVADPSPAGLTAAMAAEPSIALVGCDALANLPPDWRAPLVAVGDDDRPADVRAALAAGARSLLAWPDGAADLPGELARVAACAQPGPGDGLAGLVVGVRGVQGGAGTTTVATHLAAAWARWGPAPVLLLDLAGGLAFRLDLGAAPTWATLTPVHGAPPATTDPSGPSTLAGAGDPSVGPAGGMVGRDLPADVGMVGRDGPVGVGVMGRDGPVGVGMVSRDGPVGVGTVGHDAPGGLGGGPLDAGALIGTLAEPWAGLSVLPLPGLADGAPDPPPEPWAVQHVLEAARSTFRVVVVDLPATDGPAVQAALSQIDALVAVARCETAGVRGLQAALDGWAAAGRDPESAGAVVTGVRPRAPVAPREVRGALGDRLWGLIPAASAELAAAAEDGVLLLDRHDLPAVQALVALANRVVPFTAVSA
jgi:Flp pilus assembly CpaE family ATPase